MAHPPGYPLYTLLGRGALLVPIGEPAFRMALLSAAAAAIAVWAAAYAVRHVTGSAAGAWTAGLVLALHPAIWEAATIAEVYTLHLAFVVCLVLLARGTERAIVVAGAVLGLGLAHHPTIVLALPSAVIVGDTPVFRRASRKQLAWGAGLAVALPALLYASLLWRAPRAGESSWGRIESIGALVDHATAALYRRYDLGWSGLARADVWEGITRILGPHAWGVVPILAVVGAIAGWRVPRLRRTVLALALLVAATLVFAARYETEDAANYLIPAVAALAVLAGFGVARIEMGKTAQATRRRTAAWAAAALAIAIPLALHAKERNLSSVTAAADYGRDVLRTLDRDATLFVDGDDVFILAYLRNVLGERTDVTIYDRTGALFGDVLEEAGSVPHPITPELRQRREIELIVETMSAPNARPVFSTVWPGYDLPQGFRFEPYGLVQRVARSTETPHDDTPLWRVYREAEVQEQAQRIGGAFATALAAWYPTMRGERALFLGRRDEAERAFDRARAIGGATEAIRNALGVAYGRSGDLARAAREFEEATRLHPTSTRAWANLATARSLQGDRSGADAAMAKVREIEAR